MTTFKDDALTLGILSEAPMIWVMILYADTYFGSLNYCSVIDIFSHWTNHPWYIKSSWVALVINSRWGD